MTDTTNTACPPANLQHAIDVFRRHAFAAILTGEAPSLADLAEAASREAVGVAQAIAWLEARGALQRDGDHLIGAHGLTCRPTPHAVTLAARTVHTWCAFDAVAIPIALSATTQATTACPTCHSSLIVDIHDGNLPANADPVLWLPAGECRNMIADFCAHANLFCNHDHLTTWRQDVGDPSGRMLHLGEVPAMARAEWGDIAHTLR